MVNSAAEDLKEERAALAAINAKLRNGFDDWEHDLPKIIKHQETKMYAHADGSYSVNVGVHICGTFD